MSDYVSLLGVKGGPAIRLVKIISTLAHLDEEHPYRCWVSASKSICIKVCL